MRPIALLLLLAFGAGFRPAADDVRLVLLHTNDLHGQLLPRKASGRGEELIGGAAAIDSYVAREREAAKASGAHVLLLDSGDWYQGTPEGNLPKDGVQGALPVEWMNRAGFDAAVIGNHEFDFGFPNLMALKARAKFAVLGANILSGEPPAPIAKPYVVFERGGVKIAFVGLLTADTPRMVVKGRLGDVTIPDEYVEARKWVDRAKKEADLVVLVTHCGNDVDAKLAERVPEVPVILGGHSHTRIAQPKFVDHEASALSTNVWKKDVPARTYIFQSGAKAENIDRCELRIDPADKKIKSIDPKIVALELKQVGEAEATKKWIADEAGGVTKAMGEVIAELTAPAKPADKGRRADPAANFVSDAMLRSARELDPAVVAAFGNGGGIRAKLETGPVTLRALYEVVPFDNTIVLMTMKGSDLVALLEETLGAERGARLLPAGLVGAGERKGDGAWDWSAIRIGGAPLEPKKEYRVAANSFIADGNGGCASFKRGTDRRDAGVLVQDAMIDYARAKKAIALDDELRVRVKR